MHYDKCKVYVKLHNLYVHSNILEKEDILVLL